MARIGKKIYHEAHEDHEEYIFKQVCFSLRDLRVLRGDIHNGMQYKT
jgi:hypothetical protein